VRGIAVNPSVVKRLSGLDAAFLFAETDECPVNVGSLRIWNPSEAPDFSFGAVKDLLAARLPELPVLRYRVAGSALGVDRPWFVESTEVDIDFHIRRIAVPEPGGRRNLDELVGLLLSYPLNRARPLWELWFIEGVEHGRVATLTKYHHALIDGVSGTRLGEKMFDTSPEPRPPAVEASQSSTGPSIPRFERRALGAILNLIAVTPYRVLRVVQQTVAQRLAVRGLPNRPPRFFQAPATRFNSAISAQRRVSSSRLPLDRLTAAKRAFGVKLNDVVLAVVAGALRSYLEDRGELPERSLVAQMPISTHGDSTEVGNQITTMSIRLATDVADPAQRIKTIFGNTQGAKEMAKVLRKHQRVGLTETVPTGLLGLAVRAYTASHLGGHVAPINLAVANTTGPDYPLYLAGAVLEQVVPFGPLMLNVGLFISTFSSHGWVHFGLTTTPQIASDIDQLADAMESALIELEEAAGLV
jgi:diacylglycerol O-acyltransferase / wax synthase